MFTWEQMFLSGVSVALQTAVSKARVVVAKVRVSRPGAPAVHGDVLQLSAMMQQGWTMRVVVATHLEGSGDVGVGGGGVGGEAVVLRAVAEDALAVWLQSHFRQHSSLSLSFSVIAQDGETSSQRWRHC